MKEKGLERETPPTAIVGAVRDERAKGLEPSTASLEGREPTVTTPTEQMWVRPVRHGISGLDRLREEMMRSGAGVTAMLVMLDDLTKRMVECPVQFGSDHAEKLAWLLGAPACSFWIVEPGHALPGEEGRGSRVLSLIHDVRPQGVGEKLSVKLRSLIDSRRDTLRQQRELCSERYTSCQEKLRETAALLPDAEIRWRGR